METTKENPALAGKPVGTDVVDEFKDDSINAPINGEDPGKSIADPSLPSPAAAYFKLWSFASPLDVALRCLAATMAAGSGTAEPMMAIVFGNLVNLFNGTSPVPPEEFRSQINKNALYFLYLFIGKFFLVYMAATLFNFTSARMTSKIRLRYLRKVLHQPISYFDTHATGSISASLSNDANVVQVGLAEKLGIVCQALSMMLSAFIVAFTRQWKLTLVTAVVIPYMIISTGFFGGWSAQVEAKANEGLNEASGIAEEALSSILNITAIGAGDKIVRRFDAVVKDAMRYFKQIGPLQACIYGNMFFSVHSAYALALFYGVKLVNRGEVTDGGAIVTVLFCVILASSSMGFIAPLIPDLTKAAAAAQQILKVIGDPKEQEESNSTGTAQNIELLEGRLEFANAVFSYPERPTIKVVDNVNLEIQSGKVTAIVGQSGSGKSTLIGLLERWYTIQEGQILVDGHSLYSLDLQWWRSQIGLVQQEPMLFNDTIYNNVQNGLRGQAFSHLSDAQKRELVINACKQANAHSFIEHLPQGYETLVGERAGSLSGGQRQRIAIARSIISNPKILLFDEATSNLDVESERAVLTALENVGKGKTVVMIAHKLSTIQKADQIVVFSKGKITEQGTHSELLAMNGQYCRLLQAQDHAKHIDQQEDGVEEDPDAASIGPIVRKLTRVSTKAADDAPDPTVQPLESTAIGRRHGIFWCIYKIYSANPSFILLSVPGLIGALIAGSTFPLQAVFFSRLVTVFSATGTDLIRKGNFWALMFFILALACIISYLMLFTFMGIVSAKVGFSYRHSYLRAMLRQDIEFFQAGGNTSGGLTALLAADGVDLSMLFASNSGLIVIFTITLLSCCIISIAVYWKLGLVAVFGCIPALLAAGFLRMRIDLTAQDRCAAAFLECARYSNEAVAAIRTVSSLTMESKIEALFATKLNSASKISLKKTLASMILYALSDALVLAASGLVFWYGGRLASFGELSTTQFFMIFAAVIFGGQSAGFMFGYTTSINKSQAAMNRILYLSQSNPTINSSSGSDPDSADWADGTPTVEFRNVNFCYPSRPTTSILRGLSLSINRGSHVCVVGPSGCGKSTLIALIERFYDLKHLSDAQEQKDTNEIFIYGQPISHWDITKLRKTIGLVSQDTTLYQGTIRDNVLLGVEEANLGEQQEVTARMEAACKQANIHEFITSLPNGYDTHIGARGVALSGGQRQRLALARCLIRNPQLLLLDEATSALDPESQKAVLEALAKARSERENMTIISVTHQTEVMKGSDCIFVVDRGVLIETGTWEELIKRRGRLWSMVVQGEVDG